jgi:hypothetical protein
VGLPQIFDDQQWWIVFGVSGGLIAAASAPVMFVPGFLVGLGLLLFGAGQWIDRPLRVGKAPRDKDVKIYTWQPSAFGLAVMVTGVASFGVGLFRLIVL